MERTRINLSWCCSGFCISVQMIHGLSSLVTADTSIALVGINVKSRWFSVRDETRRNESAVHTMDWRDSCGV